MCLLVGLKSWLKAGWDFKTTTVTPCSWSWLLWLKYYEPHSLMIGNDREWSPITFRSPYCCFQHNYLPMYSDQIDTRHTFKYDMCSDFKKKSKLLKRKNQLPTLFVITFYITAYITKYILTHIFVITPYLTYCTPKCVQFAAVILEINFQFLAYMWCPHMGKLPHARIFQFWPHNSWQKWIWSLKIH